jgi:hypothetical protein
MTVMATKMMVLAAAYSSVGATIFNRLNHMHVGRTIRAPYQSRPKLPTVGHRSLAKPAENCELKRENEHETSLD